MTAEGSFSNLMIIRRANDLDAGPVARVHVASWQEAYRGIVAPEYLAGLSVSEREKMWAKSIRQNMTELLVAEIDGRIVGFSAIGPCRDEGAGPSDYEIWAIYAAPTHWSRGGGRELWLASRDSSTAKGAARISLWVIANNERAIRFYRAAGFRPEVDSRKPYELGGATLEKERYVWESGKGDGE